jgi:hypothetical protein
MSLSTDLCLLVSLAFLSLGAAGGGVALIVVSLDWETNENQIWGYVVGASLALVGLSGALRAFFWICILSRNNDEEIEDGQPVPTILTDPQAGHSHQPGQPQPEVFLKPQVQVQAGPYQPHVVLQPGHVEPQRLQSPFPSTLAVPCPGLNFLKKLLQSHISPINCGVSALCIFLIYVKFEIQETITSTACNINLVRI